MRKRGNGREREREGDRIRGGKGKERGEREERVWCEDLGLKRGGLKRGREDRETEHAEQSKDMKRARAGSVGPCSCLPFSPCTSLTLTLF